MDVACGEYGDVIAGLVSGIENGRLVYQENSASAMTMQSPTPGMYYSKKLLCQFLSSNTSECSFAQPP